MIYIGCTFIARSMARGGYSSIPASSLWGKMLILASPFLDRTDARANDTPEKKFLTVRYGPWLNGTNVRARLPGAQSYLFLAEIIQEPVWQV